MKKFLLLTIVILAALLRLVALDRYPAGLNADEAALGYNAYSLLLTGRDEHGHVWPVNLESFGDFKPGFYAYLLIPFIKFLGLTELAVRLPSALIGILAVVFIYLLAKEIFSNNDHISLLAAFLLAVSPWHLHFSRGGWEVNLATTLILIGTWSFLRWIKSSKFWFLLSTVLCFSLSMYTYQSARVIAPLLGLGLLLLYSKTILAKPKTVIVPLVVLVLSLIPLLLSLTGSNAASRLAGVGLLADAGPLNRVKQLRGQHVEWNSVISRLLHNQPVIYTLQFVKNYTDHFDPNFLFISGDLVSRNLVPETGQLYLTDALFIVLGLIFLLKLSPPHGKVIFLWLIVAPVASAMTFQTPSALRSQNMIIPLTLITAFGLYSFFAFIAIRRHLVYLIALVVVTGYGWQIARYLHEYYVHYPQAYPAAWEYGFNQLVPYVLSVKDKYDRIYITDKYDQPYILFLFYSKYPPAIFQNHHQLTFRDKFNFSTVRAYDKYYFTSTPWDKVRDIHSALIVAAPEDIPPVGVNVIKTIYFPDGQPAFKIISN